MVGSIHLNLGKGSKTNGHSGKYTWQESGRVTRAGGCGHRTDSLIQSLMTQQRLHIKMRIMKRKRRMLGSAISFLGVLSCQPGVMDPALDLTLFQNLLHRIGQGEISITALRQAASWGPSATPPMKLCPMISQGPSGQV